MHKTVSLLCMFHLCIVNTTIHSAPMAQVRSWFGAKPYEAIIEKDYTLHNHGSLIIKNMHGNITIKTGLDKKTVAVRTIKHATMQEYLDHMHIIEEETNPEQLTLRTTYDYEKVKGVMDYTITVPDDIDIHLSTETGDISVANVHGSIVATTGIGTITIERPTHKTQATVTQQGNITIIHPEGPVDAKVNKGALTIRHSCHGVHAYVKQGKIDISCRNLPEKQSMVCDIVNGPIVLHLPKQINSLVEADAPEGLITSAIPICIHEQTTMLNAGYWDRMKKQLQGSIGSPDASIKLFAQKGSIKIIES